MAQRGGKREGAGKPKGFKAQSTIERDVARKLMNDRILKRLNPLLNSQFVVAQGVTYVYKIVESKDDKGKTYKRETILVTDPEEIRNFLDEHEGSNGVMGEGEDSEYYFITTEKPDTRAIDSMLDRVFGKATQGIELDNPKENQALKEINDKLKEMHINAKSGRTKTTNT